MAFLDRPGVLVTIGVYLDKAGPSDAIQAVSVAGVLMQAEQVADFTEEWTRALHEFDDLPYFHMTDYDSGHGFYEEWQERGVKQERLGILLAIIEKYVMAFLGSSVSLADCAKWAPHQKPLAVGYSLAASHCFNMLPQYGYLLDHPRERVIYTFEAGDSGHAQVEAVYGDMYATDWRKAFNRLDGKLEVNKKEFPPLQVADILAFEGWKQWARDRGGDTRPVRYPWQRLSQSIINEWAMLRLMSPLDAVRQSSQAFPFTPPISKMVAALLDTVMGEVPTAPLTLPRWG